MILRMKLNKWSDLEANIGCIKVPVKVGRSIGYMEVFDDLQEMRKEYPKENDYVEIAEVTKKK